MNRKGLGEIARRCRERLGSHYGVRLRDVVLHGSALHHDGEAIGDIDLLVVLRGPVNHASELRVIIELLYEVQLDCDCVISAKPVHAEDYDAGSIQFYRNAREEGVAV